MRICPLHKTELVYQNKEKYKLVCQKNNCPHTEYTSQINPSLTLEDQVYVYVPSFR